MSFFFILVLFKYRLSNDQINLIKAKRTLIVKLYSKYRLGLLVSLNTRWLFINS